MLHRQLQPAGTALAPVVTPAEVFLIGRTIVWVAVSKAVYQLLPLPGTHVHAEVPSDLTRDLLLQIDNLRSLLLVVRPPYLVTILNVEQLHVDRQLVALLGELSRQHGFDSQLSPDFPGILFFSGIVVNLELRCLREVIGNTFRQPLPHVFRGRIPGQREDGNGIDRRGSPGIKDAYAGRCNQERYGSYRNPDLQ